MDMVQKKNNNITETRERQHLLFELNPIEDMDYKKFLYILSKDNKYSKKI